MTDTPHDGRIDRRSFLSCAGAVFGGLVVAPGLVLARPRAALAGQRKARQRAFDVVAKRDGVRVDITQHTNPRRLNLTVFQHGDVVETYRNVHPYRMKEIVSRYFGVRYIRAPGP